MTSPSLHTGIQTGGARHGGRWQRQWGKLVGFRLFGEFISSVFRLNGQLASIDSIFSQHGCSMNALLCMSGAGHSCGWLLVGLLALTPQAQDTPTAKRQRTPPCVGVVTVRPHGSFSKILKILELGVSDSLGIFCEQRDQQPIT